MSIRDNIDMIKLADLESVLNKLNEEEGLDVMSETHSKEESAATLLAIKAIKEKTAELYTNGDPFLGAIHDLGWIMYLVGYEVGKMTHSYKLEV